MSTKGEAVVIILQDGTKLSVFHIVLELYPYWIVCIVEECGRGRNALLDVCLMVGIQCPLYRHDSFLPRVSGVKFVLAHITLGLVPNAVELCTFDNHREILMLNCQ